MVEYWIEKSIIYTSSHYELSIETAEIHFMNFFKKDSRTSGKIKENLSNEIMSSILPPRLINYNLWTQSNFLRNSVNSSKYALNSKIFSFKGLANGSIGKEKFEEPRF